MTAHKHAEMIKAKADNMDLVVFRKNYDNTWGEIQCYDCVFMSDFYYFLCLPQHKEACLHWLNGGLVQVKYKDEDWKDVFNPAQPTWHGKDYFMMRYYVGYRINPRKEKRWIGYCSSRNQTFPNPQHTIELAESYAESNYGYDIAEWQFIEIEVEI